MCALRTGNRESMRELNRALVLNMVRRGDGDGLAAVDIVKNTQLSAATVTSILRELRDVGFVEPVGTREAATGRKPLLLRFNPEAQYVISVKLFADDTQLGLVDLAGRIKSQTTFPTDPQRGPQAVFESLAEHSGQLLKDKNISIDSVMGAGIAIEGMSQQSTGELIFSVNLGWRNIAVKDWVKRLLGIEAEVISDSVAMAIGEYCHGAGQAVSNLTVLEVDAGMAAVAVSNGTAWRGAHNMAGEVGHTVMNPDGPLCRCGNYGCLEALACGWAIVCMARKAIAEGKTSAISDEVHSYSTRLAVRAVFAAASQGDLVATEILRDAGYWLGLGVAAIINWNDPELIVLTGCVLDECSEMFLDIVRDVAGKNVVNNQHRTWQIAKGILGKDATLVGAASIVYEKELTLSLS